jgi:predicted lysophospholipase L1 biosynthesis ABC-type transport system permease subunit
VSSPELASLVQTQSQVTAHGEPTTVTFGHGKLVFDAGYGEGVTPTFGSLTGPTYQTIQGQIQLTAARPDTLAAIPAIATTSYLHANSLHIGSTQEVTVNGIQVPVEIVATAAEFPTVSASGGALIVDLPALQEYLATQAGTPVPVTEWWLATRDDTVAAAAVAAALPAGTVITSRTALADAITQDPVSLAPQQALLATAATAALLAIAGFAVSIAASIRQRRAESALLAALGVGPRTTAWQLCLEKLMLSLPSAVLGLVLGAVLARLLVPAVTLTTTATTPVPPPITMLNLADSVPLALVIAIAPTLVAAAALLRRPDPATELRAAEAGT